MKAKRKRPSPLSARVLTPPAPLKEATKPGHQLLAALALLVLTGLAFSNSFQTGLTLDNQLLISGDPRIREVTTGNIAQIWQHTFWWPNGEAGIYRPLTTLSFLFNYAVLGNGVETPGYQWINFLLHAANVLLVFALAQRLFSGSFERASRGFQISFFIAALWAVHPALTEAVTNIIGRADLLAGTAVLSGLLFYLKTLQSTGLPRLGWLGPLAAAATTGALSKESAVVLPAIIVIHWLLFNAPKQPRNLRALIAGCSATLLPIGLVLWQRALVISASAPAEFPFVDNPIVGATFWIGRLTALQVLGRYLWLTVWPFKLSADYSYAAIPLAHGSFSDWLAWIVVAALAAVTIFIWKRSRGAAFFACFGFLNLLPASNLLFPIGTIMAERLLYLPLVGWLACLVLAIEYGAARVRIGRLAPLLFLIIILGFASRTWLRNLDWKDNLTIATATVATSPGSFKSHRLLAVSLFQSDPEYVQIDRVIREANQGLDILKSLPDKLDVPEPWNEAASYYLAKGDSLHGASKKPFEEAARLAAHSIAIEAAVRADHDRGRATKAPMPPVVADSYRLLAAAHLRLGEANQALAAALEAHSQDPSNVEVYGQIADAYLAQSKGEEAAITLAEGMFATSNASLREDLLKLYQSGVDTSGCAVVSGLRGPALNPECAIVHRDLCAGVLRAKRMDLLPQLHCSK